MTMQVVANSLRYQATSLTIALLFFLNSITQSNAQRHDYVRNEVLVQLMAEYSTTQVELMLNEVIGILPYFKFQKTISAPMRIHLFTFNEDEISMEEMLRVLNHTDGVTVAQRNHIVQDRVIPDDPFFGSQWHHVQTDDHDIDSDLAWDITTGGTTLFGDDIVACVIETGGADWDHTDLIANHWVNENEIPDNSIDDDDNGYVDDYDGWSLVNENDNINAGNHGTAVSSMIGASGNNETGITGVNWNVKLMQVHMGGVSEANVVEAYTYPLVMRKLYNETGGAKGAFVVVTNSSWGIDGGQPEDSPLWCAMYDSLGTYGVLSCGATANNNVNIDVVGDLPTACPSDYLISVTATNDEDERTFSAYGITHVDLAAPGDDVYLASNTNNYSVTSGTSFATPCVAGAVALLYSAECISLNVLAQADPAATASLVRQYILNGIDAVNNLADEVATGGRLNVNNSLLLLLDECENTSCIPPFGITAIQMEDALNYTISWNSIEGMESFNLRYRQVGASEWMQTDGIVEEQYLIIALSACTEYEVQLQASCGDEFSNWSASVTFLTDGCCVNPETSSIEIQFTSAESISVNWENVFASVGYEVSLGDADGNALMTIAVNDTSAAFDALSPCTTYTLWVETICMNETPPTAQTIAFSTAGCGDCTDLEYCQISGDASLEWIAQVQIGTINNSTTSDGGYGDYTGLSTALPAGDTYTIGLTPGYAGFSYSENFRVWIDFNTDGEFSESEMVFETATAVNSYVEGNIAIPNDMAPGSVRLRVGMSYAFDPLPEPCGEIQFGETEDYCIDVLPVGISEHSGQGTGLAVSPNPASDFAIISSALELGAVQVLDIAGKTMIAIKSGSHWVQLDTSALHAGVYLVQCGAGTGKLVVNR